MCVVHEVLFGVSGIEGVGRVEEFFVVVERVERGCEDEEAGVHLAGLLQAGAVTGWEGMGRVPDFGVGCEEVGGG